MKVNKLMPWEQIMAEACQKKADFIKSMYLPDKVETTAKNTAGIIGCRTNFLYKFINFLKKIF